MNSRLLVTVCVIIGVVAVVLVGTIASNMVDSRKALLSTAVPSPNVTAAPSASDTVATFYRDIDAKHFDEAYALLSDSYRKGTSLVQFKAGYATTRRVTAHVSTKGPMSVETTLYAEDTATSGERDRIFKGIWTLVKEGGGLRLDGATFTTVADSAPKPTTSPVPIFWDAPTKGAATPDVTPTPNVVYVPPAAGTADCEDESIQTVSDSGEYLVMDSGQSYHVLAGDEATAMAWVAGDSVKICDDKIINIDENGETVDIY